MRTHAATELGHKDYVITRGETVDRPITVYDSSGQLADLTGASGVFGLRQGDTSVEIAAVVDVGSSVVSTRIQPADMADFVEGVIETELKLSDPVGGAVVLRTGRFILREGIVG